MNEPTVAQQLREQLQSDAMMEWLMTGLFGPDNWVFDPAEDARIAPNTDGPGHYVVRRGGNWVIRKGPVS